MANKEIVRLRRLRARVHTRLRKLEPQVAAYHAKLAEIEAEIRAIDPYYLFPRRHRTPNAIFARNETARLVLNMLREAGEPMATRDIARRLLAIKGITSPDRKTWQATRLRTQQLLGDMDKRGMIQKVGTGNDTKRVIAKDERQARMP